MSSKSKRSDQEIDGRVGERNGRSKRLIRKKE